MKVICTLKSCDRYQKGLWCSHSTPHERDVHCPGAVVSDDMCPHAYTDLRISGVRCMEIEPEYEFPKELFTL